jgi:hypothetical protein
MSFATPPNYHSVASLTIAPVRVCDKSVRVTVRLEQRLCAEMGPLLLELARTRGYRAYGCPSLGVFAREWLGISPRKVQALLRLERACVLSAPLCLVWRAGRLSWRQAHVLVPLLVLDGSGPWHAAWVARAQGVTVRRLEDDVDRAIVSGVFDPEAKEGAADDDPHTGARRMAALGHPTPYYLYGCPRDVARLFRAVLATVQRRIERRTGRPARESERTALRARCEAREAAPRRLPLGGRGGLIVTPPAPVRPGADSPAAAS